MHTVECPHCRSKFRVAAPVTAAKMKCSRCGQVFVGSSVASAGAGPGAPAPGGPPHAPAAPAARRSSPAAIAMLVACFVGVVGVIAMLAVIAWVRAHPRLAAQDLKTGEKVELGRLSEEEARRRVEEEKRKRPAAQPPGAQAALPTTRGTAGHPGPTGAGPGAGEEAPPPLPKGDPLLDVGQIKPVSYITIPGVTYACGRLLNRHPTAMRSVKVSVYVDGRSPASAVCEYVPAGATIRYSAVIRSGDVTGDRLTAIATGEAVGPNVFVWAIDPPPVAGIARDGKVTWSGRTRNATASAVGNVKIHCDFYDGDGVWRKHAVGALSDAKWIGVGQSAAYQVDTDEDIRDTCQFVEARAVADKQGP